MCVCVCVCVGARNAENAMWPPFTGPKYANLQIRKTLDNTFFCSLTLLPSHILSGPESALFPNNTRREEQAAQLDEIVKQYALPVRVEGGCSFTRKEEEKKRNTLLL